MAWHSRHVSPANSHSSPRITVLFERKDLLWVPPKPPTTEFIKNPYTKENVLIPYRLARTGIVGPNILDAVKTVERSVYKLEKMGHPKAKPGRYFVIRKTDELFEKPEVLKKKMKKIEGATEGKQELMAPFKTSLCTVGHGTGTEYGSFIEITKKSSVSISKLVFLLAQGVYGTAGQTSAKIAEVSAIAWEDDLKRSRSLFEFVRDAGELGVHEDDVPSNLRAGGTISQEVETHILRSSCISLGIDPDSRVNRKRGRPKRAPADTGADTETDSHSGRILTMSIADDGTVSGSIYTVFADHAEGTDLSSLSLMELAELLVLLHDAEEELDAELLEAYLDASDPDWRDTVLGEEPSVDAGGSYDAYAVLGVEPTATWEEVKRAYRKAISVLHPDKTGLPGFFAQELIKAYTELKRRFANE